MNVRESTSDFLNGIQKVCLDDDEEECRRNSGKAVSFGNGVYAGAPVFVAKEDAKDEDDGYILSQLYMSDTHKTNIAILDAKSMKLLTMLELECHIPYQFHGAYWPL